MRVDDEERYEEAVKLYREENLKRVELCRRLELDYDAFTYYLKSRYPELIRRNARKKTSDYIKRQKQATAANYKPALKLCQDTELTYKEIAEKTGVSLSGLKTYIATYHRDLMLRRRGREVSKRGANALRVRKRSGGQTIEGHERYKEAITACDDERYIELTVSQIAEEFNVPATGLLGQLRDHYPEISERREKERRLRGLADNHHRGVREITARQYADAIELLRNADITIEEAARQCGVSFGGLRNYMLSYHRDIVENRRKKSEGKYEGAISEFVNSERTAKEIAEEFGLVYNSFASYLRRNHIKKREEGKEEEKIAASRREG